MKTKWLVYSAFFLSISCTSSSKTSTNGGTHEDITIENATRIENFLAADNMKGRKLYSPELDRAADFIANEFRMAGLQPLAQQTDFLQKFSLVRAKQTAINAIVNGNAVPSTEIAVITTKEHALFTQADGFEVVRISDQDVFSSTARKYLGMKKKLLVLCDPKHNSSLANFTRYKSGMFSDQPDVIFLSATTAPTTWSVDVTHEINRQQLMNVAGMIPGKSRPDEFVIFSGHYDHIGTTTKPVNGDSIFNGANDDAAGITSMIMLAKYYARQKNNERTLIFVAFTGEESGGFGSQYFSGQMDPARVIAMFNIEMIGTESKWGKGSAYITGFDKSSLGEIMQKNVKGSGFSFYADPYTAQQLFYRSDNATLARQGVPAHTISTSKMDNEPNYHQLSDEVSTLNLANLVEVTKAIAMSATTIISGMDTPTRVNASLLR
jgi:hypothetical protein